MPAASSIYWNSVDSQQSSEGSSGGASGSSGSRQYVDPWDLENYAYLRRHSIVTPPPPQQRVEHPSYPPNLPPKRSDLREPDYWYAPRVREPGYDAPASVEELYFGPPRQTQQHFYYYQQPIYEDDAQHYVAPNPVYAPLSDLEYCEGVEEQRLKEMIRRRSKLSRAKGHRREECLYHGSSGTSMQDSVEETSPMAEETAARYVEVIPPTKLGLNTYGHLKIDYTNSWNSLHRKISK